MCHNQESFKACLVTLETFQSFYWLNFWITFYLQWLKICVFSLCCAFRMNFLPLHDRYSISLKLGTKNDGWAIFISLTMVVIYKNYHLMHCPVGCGWRIHRLHLGTGVKPHQRVSWIWHQTIWWWVFSNSGVLGDAEYPFIAITPRSTLAQSGSTW